MAEREKYYIGLNGQIFEVSKELYETYYKGQRKEKYFTHDLKQEHTKVDKENRRDDCHSQQGRFL